MFVAEIASPAPLSHVADGKAADCWEVAHAAKKEESKIAMYPIRFLFFVIGQARLFGCLGAGEALFAGFGLNITLQLVNVSISSWIS